MLTVLIVHAVLILLLLLVERRTRLIGERIGSFRAVSSQQVSLWRGRLCRQHSTKTI